MISSKGMKLFSAVLCAFIVQFFSINSYSATSSTPASSGKTATTSSKAAATDKSTTSTKATAAQAMSMGEGESGGTSGSGTVSPDLFTGAMSYSIPIEAPAGRKGIAAKLALTYRSYNGNGWVGMGWDIEIGAIERSTKNGVNYTGDEGGYVLRMAGSAIDLVRITTDESGNTVTNEYRGKIEGGFLRIRKLSGTNGDYWEVTDKSGTRHLYGQTAASRQDDSADPTRIFKWALDRVQDMNGNYMTFSYTKDQGQIYPDQIDYTGNGTISPTNYVKFYLESRADAGNMYSTNFSVNTAKRVKTIDVVASGNRQRVYKLTYIYSASTSRSVLASMQLFGKDANVDTANGAITNETTASKLPATQFGWQMGDNTFTTPDYNHPALPNAIPDGYLTRNSPNVYTYISDFNGDGVMDIMWIPNNATDGRWLISYGTATGFTTPDYNHPALPNTLANGYLTRNNSNVYSYIGDFNGDGKADFLWIPLNAPDGRWCIAYGNTTGFTVPDCSVSPALPNTLANGYLTRNNSNVYTYVEDFNGDGKTDFLWVPLNAPDGRWCIAYGTATGFAASDCTNNPALPNALSNGYLTRHDPNVYTYIGDFNGDGKRDFMWIPYNSANGGWLIAYGAENGFNLPDPTHPALPNTIPGGYYNRNNPNVYTYVGDFNGDGSADFLWIPLNGADGRWLLAPGQKPDLLSTISNGIGGATTIAYTPSTHYQNTQLPFPIQTVSAVTTNDGNGMISTMTYTYSGGFHHIGERDFRGFNYAQVTGPVGPNNERSISETWFHQGNEVDVISASTTTAELLSLANVTTGYMKGKPYRTKVTDGQGHIFSETTTSYVSDDVSPYFNPPLEVNGYLYNDNGTSSKQIRTRYTYDNYGNVTQEDQYGDLADTTDDRTATKNFAQNTTDWILNKPTNESIYSGVTGTTLVKVAQTDFYYDGVTACTTASTNQMPTKGNVTRIVRWLNGGTSPEVRMAYDSYGNINCTRDAKGNISTATYDSTFTFLTIATNPLGHQTSTKYYGVNSEPLNNGLYGQVKSITDPNSAITSVEYDTFGRKTRMTAPDTSWTSWSYNNFGTLGSQHVRTDTAAGLSSWSYFDGMGRTILAKKSGPDSKIIATQTQYNVTGTVSQKSLPYFDGTEAPRWGTFTYDALGRTIRADNPDGTRGLICYNVGTAGITDTIDANNLRKRATKNAQGKLVKVDEYQGSYTACTTDPGTPYATTTYQYDVMGRLRFVTDAENNQTEMRYDTLGRKTYMHDPDMGSWSYAYDGNGNMTSQIDAKNQTILFTYDALNRLAQKDYPTGTDTVYTYDQAFSTYPKGRLTTMTDASGTMKYYYDAQGRTTKTIKTVDGTNYTTQITYDIAGRMSSIKYPDNDQVNYAYNTGGSLSAVSAPSGSNYVSYTNYNALGQMGAATFGNGVTTTYAYNPLHNRLSSLLTNKGGQNLLSVSYAYDNDGNIISITDALDASKTQTFTYDDINRLIQAQSTSYGGTGVLAYFYDQIGNFTSKEGVNYTYDPSGNKPHAVRSTSDGKTYTYDANGNMLTDGTRTITYDYDNMPQLVSMNSVTTTFVYDGAGTRVKKITPTGTTIYLGRLYECKDSVCTKYIVAGNTRIALKTGANISYYHQDHLGSSSIVTDGAGAKIEEIHYYPYGATLTDTGTASVSHKYTSQELDPETGLYNYNARFYNPALGRFISADSIVPNFADPQAFNRYSYARNNPLMYTDPSGHYWNIVSAIVGGFVGAISAGEKTDWDPKACFIGSFVGSNAGLIGGYVGTSVGSWVAGWVGGWAGSTAGAYAGAVVGGAAGGAAGGAVSGGLNAAIYGGNVGDAMSQGAAYGAIGGAISGVLGAQGIGFPSWAASAGGSYISGYVQCGSRCAQEGALYAFAGSVIANVVSAVAPYAYDQDMKKMPEKGTPEYNALAKSRSVLIESPQLSWKSAHTILLAILCDGFSHVAHTDDKIHDPLAPNRYYKVVKAGVPSPGEAYAASGIGKEILSLFHNNCTTRLGEGIWNPSQYNMRHFGTSMGN